MLKHTNLQCFVFKSLFGFLISCEKHHLIDYSSKHELPTVSYRHHARSTAEGHKPPGGVGNMGHLRLNAQWSSTFLRLHVTELPVSQLHFRAQAGRARMQLKHVFYLRLTTSKQPFFALLKWKMTQSCPGAACALRLSTELMEC